MTLNDYLTFQKVIKTVKRTF